MTESLESQESRNAGVLALMNQQNSRINQEWPIIKNILDTLDAWKEMAYLADEEHEGQRDEIERSKIVNMMGQLKLCDRSEEEQREIFNRIQCEVVEYGLAQWSRQQEFTNDTPDTPDTPNIKITLPRRCSYIFRQRENKGKQCEKSAIEGSDFCKPHDDIVKGKSKKGNNGEKKTEAEDPPEETEEGYNKLIEADGEKGLANYFMILFKQDIIPYGKDKGFFFSKRLVLWVLRQIESLAVIIGENLHPVIEAYVNPRIQAIVKKGLPLGGINTAKRLDRIHRLKGALKNVITVSKLKSIASYAFQLIDQMTSNRELFVRLNRESWLLPVEENKVIDLKTGECRDRQREDYFTMTCPVYWRPGIDRPRFKKYLAGISLGNESWIKSYRQIMAYSITGDISFKLFFVHDNEVGNNGKTLGNVLHKNLLGPFALEAKDFLFLQKGTKDAGDSPSPSLAELQWPRYLSLSDIEEGYNLRISMTKKISGGDPITGRDLHCPNVTFISPAKLSVFCNVKPDAGTNVPVWNRLRRLFWPANFTKIPVPGTNDMLVDEDLKEKMPYDRDDLSAYLNFLVEGCVMLHKDGFVMTPEITGATNEYKEECDHHKRFISECTKPKVGSKIKPKDLYSAYKEWDGVDTGVKDASANAFGRSMTRLGIQRHNTGDKEYKDIELTAQSLFPL